MSEPITIPETGVILERLAEVSQERSELLQLLKVAKARDSRTGRNTQSRTANRREAATHAS